MPQMFRLKEGGAGLQLAPKARQSLPRLPCEAGCTFLMPPSVAFPENPATQGGQAKQARLP